MHQDYIYMIEKVYQRYFNPSGQCLKPNITFEEVYADLTSEPYRQEDPYFNEIPEHLKRALTKLPMETLVNWNKRDYLVIDPLTTPPEGAFLEVRVVANIYYQEYAIMAALQLYDGIFSKSPDARSISKLKILLGPNVPDPVKTDKIVIYNRVPLNILDTQRISVAAYLEEQMSFLSRYCQNNAPLPAFVRSLYNHVPVGYGEGIDYKGQTMTFSEPRAQCVKQVLENSAGRSIDLKQFDKQLSDEFKKIKLSGNIPFINRCEIKKEIYWR